MVAASSGGNRCYLDIAANTWSSVEIGDGHMFANYVASAYDSNRGEVLTYSSGLWETVDVATLTRAWGTTNTHPDPGTHSLEFDPDRDAYVYPGGSNIYELDPDTKQWSTRTFTGETPATGRAAGDNGRFRYVPELKGYIYAPSHVSQVYFYRSA